MRRGKFMDQVNAAAGRDVCVEAPDGGVWFITDKLMGLPKSELHEAQVKTCIELLLTMEAKKVLDA